MATYSAALNISFFLLFIWIFKNYVGYNKDDEEMSRIRAVLGDMFTEGHKPDNIAIVLNSSSFTKLVYL